MIGDEYFGHPEYVVRCSFLEVLENLRIIGLRKITGNDEIGEWEWGNEPYKK